MNLSSKLRIHLRRWRGARRYGVPYLRAATLKIPRSILLNGETVPVSLPNDAGIRSDILGCLFEDVYGLAELPFTPATILDIGANVGLFSLAARSHFPAAIIHAYEPNPRSVPYLRQQAETANFIFHPEAVGSVDGIVTIAELGDTNLARTRLTTEGQAGVKQVSLEEAVGRLGGKVDLAKVDCEGAEWDLFRAKLPWQRINLLRMEYHLWGQHAYAEVLASLTRLNFEITKHVSCGDHGLVWCQRNDRVPPCCPPGNAHEKG